jgi:hypothetical protein
VPTEITNAENYGLNLLGEGAVTVSWYETSPVSLANGEDVLTLEFLVKNSCNLENALGISSRFTSAEAYIGEEMEIVAVDLGFENGQVSSSNEAKAAGFELYQNVPNPFVESTVIGFKLPKASHVAFSILDNMGRVVLQFDGQYPAGYNEINLRAGQLSADGILYYRIETPDFTATQKMTNLK